MSVSDTIKQGFQESSTGESKVTVLTRDMHTRLDQFVATELLMDKGDESILETGRRALSSAVGARKMLARKAENNDKKAQEDRRFRALLADLRKQIEQIDIQIAKAERTIEAAEREINVLESRIAVLRDVQRDLRSGKITVSDAMEREEVRYAVANWEERNGAVFDPKADNARALLQDIIVEEQIKLDANSIGKQEQSIVDERTKIAELKENRARLATGYESLKRTIMTTDTISPALQAERRNTMIDDFANVSKIEILELSETQKFMHSITHLKHDVARYNAAIDSFVRGDNTNFKLDPKTHEKIVLDSSENLDLRTRIALNTLSQETGLPIENPHFKVEAEELAMIFFNEDIQIALLEAPEFKTHVMLKNDSSIESTFNTTAWNITDIHNEVEIAPSSDATLSNTQSNG